MAAASRRLLPTLVLLLAPAVRAEPPARTDAHCDPLPAGALVRLGTMRFRDGNIVTAIALAPDGKALAVAGNQGVRLLDLATGKEFRALKTTGVVQFTHVGYTPDGKLLAGADVSGHFRFWDPATGEATGEIAPPNPVRGVIQLGAPFSFSADGKFAGVRHRRLCREPQEPGRRLRGRHRQADGHGRGATQQARAHLPVR